MRPLALLAVVLAASLAACSQLIPAPPETAEEALANAVRAAEPCRTVVTEAAAQEASRTGAAAPAINRLVLSGRDGIGWNEAPVDADTLRQYLDLTAQMLPQPLLVVRVEPGTDPAHVQRMRETLWRSLNCHAEGF